MKKKGDKSRIPTFEELESVGWIWTKQSMYHPDFVSNYVIVPEMRRYCGQIITVMEIYKTIKGHHLYGIEEDNKSWRWCLDFFDQLIIDKNKCTEHEEGMTAIDGWAICKHCGTNLREIK